MSRPLKNDLSAAEIDIQSIIDPGGEQMVDIDIDNLDEESTTDATELINSISTLYGDEEFLTSRPGFKKCVDAELESLRINLKMRKADEIAHDILLKNIGMSPSNASIYRSLTEIQKTIISITTKIEDSMTKLRNMLKGYQLEIDFDNGSGSVTDDNDIQSKSYKGSKQFIEAMDTDDDDVIIPADDDDDEF